MPIGDGGLLPLIGTPPMHTGVVLAVLVCVATVVVMRRTVPGYELRAVGTNPRAAQVHGVRIGRIAVGSLVVGGALAGFAGAIEVAGVHGKLIEGMQSNYLLLGIIIGLIARATLAVPFVAFGIAVLEVGASAMQRTADVPSEMVLITEALILLFLLFSDVVGARLEEVLAMNEVIPFLQLVVTAMVPYILAAQGTMLAGRAGVFNVAQEGVMMLGASVGFLVSLKMGGNPAGLLVAALVGAGFGWFLGWVTTRFRLDQFVIGLALFFAAIGIASLLYKVVIGVTLTPPLIDTLPDIQIPLLSQIPGIGTILFTQDAMVYFAFLISGLLYWMLYRTNLGLKLRSVGENPKAADSLGVSVARTRIWSSTAGGALMALAGAYLPMTYTGTYTEGIVAGRGWLAIALAFFGGWRPQYILAGSAFFAGMEASRCACRWAASTSRTSSSRCCPTSRPSWS